VLAAPYALAAPPVHFDPGAADSTVDCAWRRAPLASYCAPGCGVPSPNVCRAFDHVDKNAFSTLTSSLSQPPDYRGATNPTGPAAMHTDNAAVFARTLIASPAPDSRTKTRFSPGRTGTFVSMPSDSDIVSDPSLLAR
jgi:hypothetical protein